MFKKYLKVIGTTILAVVFALTLTGCGTQPTTKANTVVIWGFVDEDVFKPIIDDFKQNNKGIEVKYYKKNLDANYENDALNSILSGAGPDVWAIPNNWVYRHKEKLAPMPGKLLDDKKIVMKDYFADVLQRDNVFDNQVYGLSPTVDVLQAYYNPLLFDQAREKALKSAGENESKQEEISNIFRNFPITWSEFDQVVPYLTSRNGSFVQVAGAAIGSSNNVSYSNDILSLLMLQNQTKMLSDDLTQATFNLPIKNSAGADVMPGKNSLDFYSKFANPADPTYAWNPGMPNDVEAFAQSKVAVIFAYSGLAGYLKQIYPDFEFERAKIPQIGEVNSIVDYAHYTTYVVPENSPLVETAWDFVVNLATDSASSYQSATKELSSKKSGGSSDTVDLKSRGSGEPSEEMVAGAESWNKGRYPVEINNQFKMAIDRVNSGSQSSQAALDTAAANITQLLRKESW